MHLKDGKTPFNDGHAGLRIVRMLEAADRSIRKEGRADSPVNEYCSIAPDVKLGKDVKLSKFINLYGCEIGEETKVGAFVEIQKNAQVGRRCKISSHTFICEGVTIEDNVFVGHGVTFINDSYPARHGSEWRTSDRKRLERRNDGGKTRGFDRFGQHHSRQCRDRGKCDRGSGQRRDQGCSAECDCGRESSESAAIYSRRTERKHMADSKSKIPFLDLVTHARGTRAGVGGCFPVGAAHGGLRRRTVGRGFRAGLCPVSATRSIASGCRAAPTRCASL